VSDHDQHLAESILGVARAASAHGAYRMAVSLAHESAQVCRTQAGGSLNGLDDALAELVDLWQEAATGLPLDAAVAGRATDLAGRIVTATAQARSR